MSELVLELCPFCNGQAFIPLAMADNKNRAQCTNCGASGAEAPTREEAAAKWNQRPGEAREREVGYAVGEDAGSEAQLNAVLAWIETPESSETPPGAKVHLPLLRVLAKTLRERQHMRRFRYHLNPGANEGEQT